MIEPSVLINIDTAPTTVIVFVDGYNSNRHTLAGEVTLPQFRGPWLLNNAGLSGLLAVVLLTLDFIRSIRSLKTRENV